MTKKKSSKIPGIFIIVIFVLVIAIFLILDKMSSATKFNTSNISGNTAGNLNNKGLFCEANGIIYYSNAYDKGGLYAYDPVKQTSKKICDGKVSSINADEHYLYYAKESAGADSALGFIGGGMKGLYRRNLNGKRAKAFDNSTIGIAHLVGNYIYYQHYSSEQGLNLYKVKIDGSEPGKLTNDAINPAGYQDGYLYYSGTARDHSIYKMDILSDTSSVIFEDNTYSCIPDGQYIYFMDAGNDYSLARINTETSEKETLTEERLDTYNLYGDYIYYQVSDPDNPCLRRMKKDGTEIETVADGVFCNINITSEYVYFNNFNNDTPVYKTPTSGSIDVTEFTEAVDAAKAAKNNK